MKSPSLMLLCYALGVFSTIVFSFLASYDPDEIQIDDKDWYCSEWSDYRRFTADGTVTGQVCVQYTRYGSQQ